MRDIHCIYTKACVNAAPNRVLAFEAAPRSLAALQASVAYHGWAAGHVTVLPEPLGNSSEEVCLQRKYPGTNVDEQRGYSRPSQLGDVKSLPQCLSGGQRRMAAEAMGDAVQPHVVRVNANGMEPQVVLGMLPMLKVRVGCVVVVHAHVLWATKADGHCRRR